MKVSRKLFEKVKLSSFREYEIAHSAGIHPSTMSRLICGIEKIRLGDKRVLAIGHVLGLSKAECFEVDK